MWMVVDTETTGLDPTKHSILSFAAILVDNEFNIVGEPFQTEMLPTGEIDPKALEINQIDIRKITNSREDAAQEFGDWLAANDRLGLLAGSIGHNLPFDRSFMNQIPIDWDTIFDRQSLDTKVIGQYLKVCGAKIDGLSLGALVELVGDENVKALKPHGALNDCYRTLAVLKAFIALLKKA